MSGQKDVGVMTSMGLKSCGGSSAGSAASGSQSCAVSKAKSYPNGYLLRGGCIGQADAREEVMWNETPIVTLEREDHMTASRPHKVISEKRATFCNGCS